MGVGRVVLPSSLRRWKEIRSASTAIWTGIFVREDTCEIFHGYEVALPPGRIVLYSDVGSITSSALLGVDDAVVIVALLVATTRLPAKIGLMHLEDGTAVVKETRDVQAVPRGT